MSDAAPPLGSPDGPAVGELIELIERLDADNERLRLRVLTVMEWMEEAVTEQVAAEQGLERCREHVAVITEELDAIRNTRSWRLLGPPRRVHGRVRRRIDRARA